MSSRIVVLVLLLFAFGCRNDNILPPEEGAKSYFPLAQSNRWVYDETPSYPDRETTYIHVVTLSEPREYNGLRWFSTVDVCPDVDMLSPTPISCAQFSRDQNKVLVVRFGPGPAMFRPQTIIDAPLYPGKQWTIFNVDTTYFDVTNRIHVSQRSKRFVRGIERVNVPAGAFIDCVHLEDSTTYLYEVSYAGDSSYVSTSLHHSDEWFAAGIGMVKQTQQFLTSDSRGYSYSYSMKDELRAYVVRPGE